MATTTNYGWTTPDDTALVKDGAAAIRSLGSSIDTTTKNLNPSTTLGDLEYRSSTSNTNTRIPIGTSGQGLQVVAGVPAWAPSSTSTLTTTGDILYASAANTLARRAIGSTGDVLTVSGGLPTWATPSGFAWTSAASANFPTNTNTVTISGLTGKSYVIIMDGYTFGTASRNDVRFNSDTGSNYPTGDGTMSDRIIVLGSTFTTARYTALYIPDASTTAQIKMAMPLCTDSTARSYGGGWRNTSAITSITIFSSGGNNWTGGSYQIWRVS